MPYVTTASLFMICAGLTLPRTSGKTLPLVKSTVLNQSWPVDYSLFYYFTLWYIFAALSLMFIFIHGIEYVSWPRLIPSTDVIYYNGPGFRSGHKGKGFVKMGSKASSKMLSSGRKRAMSNTEEIELGNRKRVD